MAETFDREVAWAEILKWVPKNLRHFVPPTVWQAMKAAFFAELDAAANHARYLAGEWMARCCDEAEKAGLTGLPVALYRMAELIVAGPPYTIPLFPANAGDTGEGPAARTGGT